MRHPLIGLLCAIVLIPVAAFGQAMQPIRAAPSTPVESATLGTGGGARLAVSDDIPPAELEAFIDGVMRTGMIDDHIAGATVSVVQDGAVIFKKGYGFASYKPVRRVNPDTTLFRIGSITKTFTWILIMKAVEEGKIDLDAPVNNYLPPDLKIPSQGFKHEIRVRDLMTHSPGFEDRALGVIFARDPAQIRPLDRWLHETRPNRVREPGLISSYSNYGAALAGAAVAHVEGAPWQDLVEQRIFAPLGLKNISDREPYPARADLPAPMSKALAKDVSLPFRFNAGGFKPHKFEYITQVAPAGVISASAGDMARYMLMLLGDGTYDGATVFGPVAAKAFRTPMTTLPPEVGNWDAGFMATLMRGGFHVYGHGGDTLAFHSEMTLVPKLRLGIFVSTNTEGGNKLAGPVAPLVIEHFYLPPPEAPLTGTLKLAGALPYVGQYTLTRRPYSGLDGFVQSLQGIGFAYADGYLITSAGGEVRRLVPTDKPGIFKSDTGTGELMFELKKGHAPRFISMAVAGDRAGPARQTSTLGLVTLLALLTAVAVLVGFFVRLGRGMPRTHLQGIAGIVQIASAVLFLIGAAGFVFLQIQAARDQTNIVYTWPTISVLVGSWACLAASLLVLAQIGLLTPVWLGKDGEGWSIWRKARFSATVLVFAALASLLLARGALAPWIS